MSIFMSYSRIDKPFVERLCIELLKKNFKLWKDEWKLSPGESLTAEILKAIDQASFLCIVLSDHALTSKWVEQEMKAGLLAESEAKRLTILPLVIKDCEIPLPLRDRLFIDFRGDFDEALKKLFGVLIDQGELNGSHGLHEGSDYFIFYASEIGMIQEQPFVDFDIVSLDRQERFCVLTQVHCVGNEAATEDYFNKQGFESIRTWILHACALEFEDNPAKTLIRGSEAKHAKFYLEGGDTAVRIEVKVRIKRLGANPNDTLLFNIGALFQQIHETLKIESGHRRSEKQNDN